MTRSYDIRNIYVATIVKQGKTRTYVKREEGFFFRDIYSYEWDYSDEKLGIFVKTVGGYKHILTGTTYNISTRKSEGQFVIKPGTIYEVCKYDKDICKHFITKNGSYRITREQANYLEDRLNNELKAEDELVK